MEREISDDECFRLRHIHTGTLTYYLPWDGAPFTSDRYFSSCPVCGIGLTYKIRSTPMAHRECIAKVMAFDDD